MGAIWHNCWVIKTHFQKWDFTNVAGGCWQHPPFFSVSPPLYVGLVRVLDLDLLVGLPFLLIGLSVLPPLFFEVDYWGNWQG
jgi:hypothetical protein